MPNMHSITFYTLRHAETTYNQTKLFTGWHDPLLSDSGISQAQSLNLSQYSILSSDHQRCLDTLRYAKINHFETDCRLREVKLGIYEGKPIQNIEGYTSQPLDYCPPDGESFRLAYYRILSLLFELTYRLSIDSSKKYLLCTSSGIIRILKALERKPNITDFHFIKTPNSQISIHNLTIEDYYYLSKV